MKLLVAGLALVSAQAFATEKNAQGGSANAISAPSGGSATSRTVGVGLSASSNASTCYVPVLWGGSQWPDPQCQRNDDIRILHSLGMHGAAIRRACQDPVLFEAIASSKDAWVCDQRGN